MIYGLKECKCKRRIKFGEMCQICAGKRMEIKDNNLREKNYNDNKKIKL
jgi:hypothetical protein